MENRQLPLPLIIGLIAVAVLVAGAIGWWTMSRGSTPVVQTAPPSFIDPATGMPKGMGTGAVPSTSSPVGRPGVNPPQGVQ